jgi:hypothetical protein
VLSAAVVVGALGVVALVEPALALGQAPTVSAVWPRSGPVGGGTPLNVVGSGFTGASELTVDGAPVTSFTVVSDSLIHAVTAPSPTAAAGSGSVVVTSAGTSVSTPLDSYAYVSGGASVAVPSYIYPGAPWTQIDAGQPTVDLAIINPASGPGTAPDPNYASQVTTSQAAGVDVIGYVHTSYGARSLSTVENEVSEYESWYHVNGIFVDEASTSCNVEASYYAPLYAFIHAQSGLDLTVLNPGTSTNSCYMAASDILLAYEGNPAGLPAAGHLPSWAASYPSSRFWGVVYGASGTSALASTLSTLESDGFGQVYVTDGQLPNPYGALPSYWAQELTDVAASVSTPSGPVTAPTSPPPPPTLGTQTLSFTTSPPKPAVVGATYNVAASGGASGQPVVLSVDPSSGTSCTLSAGAVTFVSPGTCVIDANQGATSTFAAATQIQQSITVVAAPSGVAPRITSASSYSVAPGSSFSFTFTATGTPTPTLTVSGNLPSSITLRSTGPGTETISGSISGSNRHHRSYSLTVQATNGVAPNAAQSFTLSVS